VEYEERKLWRYTIWRFAVKANTATFLSTRNGEDNEAGRSSEWTEPFRWSTRSATHAANRRRPFVYCSRTCWGRAWTGRASPYREGSTDCTAQRAPTRTAARVSTVVIYREQNRTIAVFISLSSTGESICDHHELRTQFRRNAQLVMTRVCEVVLTSDGPAVRAARGRSHFFAAPIL